MVQGNSLFSRVKGQAYLLPLLSYIYSSPQEHALYLFSGQSSQWSPGRAFGEMHVQKTPCFQSERRIQFKPSWAFERGQKKSTNIISTIGRNVLALQVWGFSNLTGIVYNILRTAMWRMKQGQLATKGTGSTSKRKPNQGDHRNIWFGSRKSLLWNS